MFVFFLFSSTPLVRTLLFCLFCSIFLFSLALSFCNFCFFPLNRFPWHPLLKPKLLSFSLFGFSDVYVFIIWVFFFCVLCFCFSCVCCFAFRLLQITPCSLQFWCFFKGVLLSAMHKKCVLQFERCYALFFSPKPFLQKYFLFVVVWLFFFFFCLPFQASIFVSSFINPFWGTILVLFFCSIFVAPSLSSFLLLSFKPVSWHPLV